MDKLIARRRHLSCVGAVVGDRAELQEVLQLGVVVRYFYLPPPPQPTSPVLALFPAAQPTPPSVESTHASRACVQPLHTHASMRFYSLFMVSSSRSISTPIPRPTARPSLVDFHCLSAAFSRL